MPDNDQPAREFLELRVNFLTKARIATAGVGAALGLSMIAACGAASHSTGSIAPSGTAHGTFRYCSYTPDDDGIEISHHQATPCVVGDARSKKDRKKKKGTKIYVPVRPTSSTTGRSSNGSSSSTKKPTPATSKAPSPKATTTAPKLSLVKTPKPKATRKS